MAWSKGGSSIAIWNIIEQSTFYPFFRKSVMIKNWDYFPMNLKEYVGHWWLLFGMENPNKSNSLVEGPTL